MYLICAMTCFKFLSSLQMMYLGSICLLSVDQVAFPIRSLGTLFSFRLWTCWYSLGSLFWAGIMCAIFPGRLLRVTSMGVVISDVSVGECSCVMTLQVMC